ncbi:mCG145980, partial [Mus musculus]
IPLSHLLKPGHISSHCAVLSFETLLAVSHFLCFSTLSHTVLGSVDYQTELCQSNSSPVNHNGPHSGPQLTVYILCSDWLLTSHSRAHESTTPYYYPLEQQEPFQKAFPGPVLSPCHTCHHTCPTGNYLPCHSALTRMPPAQVQRFLGSFLTAVSPVPTAVLGILYMLGDYWLSQVTRSAWGETHQ